MSDEQTGIGAKPPVEAVGEIDEIGIGMLGYAFMGKAHSNAFRKIAVHDVAAAAHAEARRDRRPGRGGRRRRGPALRLRALDDRLARHRRRPVDRAVRQRRPELTPRRADDRGSRGGQARPLREAARPRRRRELRHLAARRRDRRQASLRLQLPLRAGRAACPRDDRGGRARRDPALPRPLPAGLGRRSDARHLALRRRRRPARARSAISAPT